MLRVLTVTMIAMAQSVLLDRSYQVAGVLGVPVEITVGRLLVTNASRKEQKMKPKTADKETVTKEKKQEIKTDIAPLVIPKSDVKIPDLTPTFFVTKVDMPVVIPEPIT